MLKFTKVLISLVLIVIMASCSEKVKPEDRFSEYLNSWREQNFVAMYELLSQDSTEKLTKDDFVSRYEKIYADIQARNMNITFEHPEEIKPNEKGEVSFSYTVNMDSLAGPISFTHEATLIEEEGENGKDWRIKWDPSLIFPQLDEGEKIQIVPEIPERGQIFDREGKPLAINGTLWEIGIVPGEMKEKRGEIIQQLSQLLKMSEAEIENKLSQSWVRDDTFVPLKTIDHENPENNDLLKQLFAIDSVQKKDIKGRKYPLRESAAHLTGYLRPITEEELREYQQKGYSSYEKVGGAGLEQIYEEKLHGETGWTIKVAETNEIIAQKNAVNGQDLYLTIDTELQQLLYNELKNDAGAAVAVQPTTGETLSLVSSPSYDPNDYAAEYLQKKDDPKKPFMARFNKTYSPGSTFKPITAAIALENQVITPEQTLKIKGKTWRKDSSWGSYFITRVSDKITQVNLSNALIYSDNIYFAQTALETGADQFKKGLQSFGFEEEIEFPFPMQTSSISNSDLTNEILLADSGYGQGQIQISPFHLALSYTAFLNNGNMVKPILEKQEQAKPKFWKEGIISSEHANTIVQALTQVVENENGTAYPPVPGVKLAGKTGTSELKASKGEKGEENGWFVAFIPEEKDVLIAMMIENVADREGSHYVVPKVKNVFKQLAP
ncbi:penicillin-binding transpeptidase domain-containing protein [Bacillus alveayuensis]|uniref:penicillin-binding transpeptidase domain-containing protein n=1 Tax=Aeribacillus alveayuensis TaxID=279215 RepID=UPI0005D1177E|nr:penicillin-binding transpeptidase domain-containing protein [Bacillus alveayuensis]